MPLVPNLEIVKRDLCAKWLRAIGTSLVLILAVSSALRLSFMREEQHRIPAQWLSVAPFQYETGNIAFALATGKGFSSPLRVDTGPTAWLTPIYPAIVAGFFKVFGPYTFGAFEATALLNILFSTLTCIPIYFAGARIGGTGQGALAGWLWAIFPAAVMIPFDWVWDTSLSALLAATILWATLWIADSLRWRDWFVYGILWGFTLMTNPSLGSLLPFLLGWMAWRAAKKKNPAWLRQSALTIAIIFLACLPWTIRNYRVFHALVPLRTTLGLQLWLGNNPYYIHAWGAWLHPIDNADERAKFIAMGEVPYMREKFRLGLEYMCRFPGRVAKIRGDLAWNDASGARFRDSASISSSRGGSVERYCFARDAGWNFDAVLAAQSVCVSARRSTDHLSAALLRHCSNAPLPPSDRPGDYSPHCRRDCWNLSA